jgi:hypothetical protein
MPKSFKWSPLSGYATNIQVWNILIFMFLDSRLIKMCLNETYSRVRIGKNLSDKFAIENDLKQGDALSPCFSTLLWNMPSGGFKRTRRD